jgi:dTDP-4-amino-4,6-dideoxygalactose transaminase
MIPFFDIHAGHAALKAEFSAAFDRVLASGHVIMGPELTAFESAFAEFCGAKHCIGVGNGLDALALALRARGIGPGDEVIVPSQTFIATWLAVSMVGATPVPVEIDEATYTLDPKLIPAKLTDKTAAIIPVHLYGLPADMEAINRIAKDSGLFVLEDAAQAHGARHAGKRAGALGHAAAFSFYPTKNLGGMGDGGAVVTDDDALASELRKLRNYGSREKYVHETAGVNSRLDELQAALLMPKLARLDEWNEKRRVIAARYSAGLAKTPGIEIPVVPAGCEHVYHLYVIQTATRDALHEYLKGQGIATLIHYPIAPNAQAAYRELGISNEAVPIAARVAAQTLSLPIWPQMSLDTVDEVVRHINNFVNQQ